MQKGVKRCKKVKIFKTCPDRKSIVKKNAYFCIKVTSSHLFFHFLPIQTNFRLYTLFCKKVQKGRNFQNMLGSKIDRRESCRFLQKITSSHFFFIFWPLIPISYFMHFFCKKLQKGGNFQNMLGSKIDRRESCRFLHKNHF